jgi:hypothetical protein
MTIDGTAGGEGAVVATLRRLLLVVILIGVAGLAVELVLLEHTESAQQWIPFIALAAAAAVTVAVWVRPTRGVLRAFQSVMAALLVVGAVGLWLHYQGNVEWELEGDPTARGLDLAWKALRGATPTLAPGAMAQLGLVGLVAAFRHPALRGSPRDRTAA